MWTYLAWSQVLGSSGAFILLVIILLGPAKNIVIRWGVFLLAVGLLFTPLWLALARLF